MSEILSSYWIFGLLLGHWKSNIWKSEIFGCCKTSWPFLPPLLLRCMSVIITITITVIFIITINITITNIIMIFITIVMFSTSVIKIIVIIIMMVNNCHAELLQRPLEHV